MKTLTFLIVSSFYICFTVSHLVLNRKKNYVEFGPTESNKQAKNGFRTRQGENIISKTRREKLIRKMKDTILELESQLEARLELFKSSDNSVIDTPSETQTDTLRRIEKRSPRCLFQCLRYKHLHPAQCHSLCTIAIG